MIARITRFVKINNIRKLQRCFCILTRSLIINITLRFGMALGDRFPLWGNGAGMLQHFCNAALVLNTA